MIEVTSVAFVCWIIVPIACQVWPYDHEIGRVEIGGQMGDVAVSTASEIMIMMTFRGDAEAV